MQERTCVTHLFVDPLFIDNVCLSYRHDFGLLSQEDQERIRFECKEWMRAIENNKHYGSTHQPK